MKLSKNQVVWGAVFSLSNAVLGNALAVEVHGHRGARARLPENTMPAFEYALKLGVSYLEMDLGVTSDNHLVVSHERRINKMLCLGPDGKPLKDEPLLRNLTLAEVKKYDCGSIKHPKFSMQTPVPGTRIPTLDEVFEKVKVLEDARAKKDPAGFRPVQFNIETKIGTKPSEARDTVSPKEFAALVVACIKKHGMLERTVLQSFVYTSLIEARKIEPSLRISALSENPLENLVKTAESLSSKEIVKPDFISPDFHMLSRDTVAGVHAQNVKLAPWTANTSKDWDKLLDLGVDAIITDDPEALLAHLAKKQ